MSDETNLREPSWQPTPDHRIEEGGWQKSVSSPKADSRPTGLPPVAAQPQPAAQVPVAPAPAGKGGVDG